jgi:hypothetical protein
VIGSIRLTTKHRVFFPTSKRTNVSFSVLDCPNKSAACRLLPHGHGQALWIASKRTSFSELLFWQCFRYVRFVPCCVHAFSMQFKDTKQATLGGFVAKVEADYDVYGVGSFVDQQVFQDHFLNWFACCEPCLLNLCVTAGVHTCSTLLAFLHAALNAGHLLKFYNAMVRTIIKRLLSIFQVISHQSLIICTTARLSQR